MNNTIINNWKSIIKEDDTIFHLGDFALVDDEDLKERTKYMENINKRN